MECDATDTDCLARNPLTTKNTAYHCDSRWTADGDGITDEDKHDPDGDGPLKPICEKRPYEGCCKAGAPDPIGHAVCKPEYCELQRWREIIDLYPWAGADDYR